MGGKTIKSLSTEVEVSKARLRSIAGKRRRLEYSLTSNQAKINFLEASERLEKMGSEILALTGISQLASWTHRKPWQGACVAVTAGFLAGKMRQSDVFFLKCFLHLLEAATDQEKKSN